MKNKRKIKTPQLSEKKLRMYVKIILSTLHQITINCKTYDEFKEYIASMWISGSQDE